MLLIVSEMNRLPVDLTYLVVSHLDNSRDIQSFQESNPITDSQLNDVSRWNHLLRSEFGEEFTFDPRTVYATLKNQKKQVQEFMAQEDTKGNSIAIVLRNMNVDLAEQVISLITSGEGEVHDSLMEEWEDSSDAPRIIIRPSGIWIPDFDRKFNLQPSGKIEPKNLEKVLMLAMLADPTVLENHVLI